VIQRRIRHQSAGFTLLEIVVALAVLAVALIALLTLRNHDVALQVHTRHLVTATSLARAKLDELSRVTGADQMQTSGDFGERYPGYAWSREVQPTLVPEWMEMKVTVSWPEGALPEQVVLVTYVAASQQSAP
jgi:general secretion pathway protein I